MAKSVRTISGRVCAVCGAGAVGEWQAYMEPRCAAHPHTATGRMVAGEAERKPRMGPAFQADYGALVLRVLAHSMEQMAGRIAYEMTRTTVMDMPTARALVDATVRVLAGKGPLTPDDLRYQPPLMTAAEINALPTKAREYIHQLEANTDPSGMVRENMQLLDTNKGLQTMCRNRTDELDKLKEVLERVKTGMEWTRDELPDCWLAADDEMLAEVDKVLGYAHDLYETHDKDRPPIICDRNGHVVLGLCKRCGKGEAELFNEDGSPSPCVR